jgi:hypothetical protein
MDKYVEIKNQLKIFFKTLKELKNLGVTPNSKDFTSQLGEWLVMEIFNGERAQSGIQKNWDGIVEGKKYQVKSHAKSESNKNNWSYVNYDHDADIDFIVIIIFSPEYKLMDFYKISWKECLTLIRLRKYGKVINWRNLKNYKINLNELNNQEIVLIFR